MIPCVVIVPAASHRVAVHLWKGSASVYSESSLSSIERDFLLVTKAISYTWTMAQLVVKRWLYFLEDLAEGIHHKLPVLQAGVRT